jgi:hypothetical protein
MPTVEELDRLAALLRRLGPLSEQQVGELIRAEDWNLLVRAVMETARAMVEAEAPPVPPHDHPDQVQVGWLDPRLRQMVESGPLGDSAELARLAAVERAGEQVKAALDGLQAELAELRTRLREIGTRDLERESSVNVVRRKVEGIADGRQDVIEVRAGLDAMRDRVGRAVELAERLEQDGQPVDVGALAKRVDSLEELRESLRLPTGERFDAATLERRLTELTNTLVTEAELDDALKERRAVLDPADRAAIENSVLTKVEADRATRDDALRADITTRTDQKLAGVDALVARAVADSAPAVTDAAANQIRGELDQRLAKVREEAAADARAQVDARSAELEGRLGGRLDTLDSSFDDRVRGTVDERLERVLPGAVREQVGSLGGQVAELAERLQRAEAATGGLSARVDSLQRDLRDGLAGVRTEVTASLDQRIAETEKRFDAKLAAIEPRLDDRVGGLLTERDAALRAQFTRIARDEVAGLEDRLPVIIRNNAVNPPIVNPGPIRPPLPPQDPR